MFGMGGSEIIVILIVALLFLGPDKLPGAAKSISKGIRDIKKQSRALQSQIENDEQIGGAIRDLKSALRGDGLDMPVQPKPIKPRVKKELVGADVAAITGATDATTAGAAIAVGLPTDENSILGEPTIRPAGLPSIDQAKTSPAAMLAADLGPALEPSASGSYPISESAILDEEPSAAPAPPKLTLPPSVGEPGELSEPAGDDDDLASLIKPASGTVAKGT